RVEQSDGSYSRTAFSPWHVATYDANDTVSESGNGWYTRMTAATAASEEQRAAEQAARHADTPAVNLLDSLGRDVAAIGHNRVADAGGARDEKYLTFRKLDTEGKPLWVRDTRDNLVMQHILPPAPHNQAGDPAAGYVPCYDIAGHILFQHGM